MGLVPSLNHPTSGTANPVPLTDNDDAIRTVVNGQIDADNLASNAVTTVKITDQNVTPDKMTYEAVVVRLAANTTLTNGSDIPLPWDTEVSDFNGGWAIGQPTRLTAWDDGLYEVYADISCSGGTPTYYKAAFKHFNSAGVLQSHYPWTYSSPVSTLGGFSLSAVFGLTAGDYIVLQVGVVGSGTNVVTGGTITSGASSRISMLRVSS